MSLNKDYLANLTDEDRKALQEQARISREAKKEASKNIRVSADDAHWRSLFAKYGLRSPPSVCQSTEMKYAKRMARKMNFDINYWVREVVGAKSLIELASMNPDIGQVGICGLLMEWVDEEKSK